MGCPCMRTESALKVIIETALLTDEEKVLACEIAKRAGADYVKHQPGFRPGSNRKGCCSDEENRGSEDRSKGCRRCQNL